MIAIVLVLAYLFIAGGLGLITDSCSIAMPKTDVIYRIAIAALMIELSIVGIAATAGCIVYAYLSNSSTPDWYFFSRFRLP